MTVVRRLLRLAGIVLAALVGLVAVLIVAYRWIDPPVTPLMLLRLPEAGTIRRTSLSLDEIAPALPRSVVASEDNRFCLHHGIDWDAVAEAIDDYEEDGRLRGASTITMQVARNLFLWPGGGFFRKGIEAPIALAVDFLWPKRRIIEVYLNVAEWGDGIYGAEAAAQAYFRKPARSLSSREAALMAAVLPNPRRWSPASPTRYIAGRAGTIQGRIGQLGPLLDCIGR